MRMQNENASSKSQCMRHIPELDLSLQYSLKKAHLSLFFIMKIHVLACVYF